MQNGGGGEIVTLRVRLGENEFEASGTSEAVALHFAAWRQLIQPAAPAAATEAPETDKKLAIFAVDAAHNLVSLRLYPAGKTPHADAALLLLYGFHQALGEQGRPIRASRLKAALTASGHSRSRIDRTLARAAALGWVKKDGRGKASTYQLSASGFQRAASLAAAISPAIKPPRGGASP